MIDLESLSSRARHAWAPASYASVSLAGARDHLQSDRDAAAEAPKGGFLPTRVAVLSRVENATVPASGRARPERS